MKPFHFRLPSGPTVMVDSLPCGTVRASVVNPDTGAACVTTYASGQHPLLFRPIPDLPRLHGWLSVGETQFRVHPDDVQRVWDQVHPNREQAA